MLFRKVLWRVNIIWPIFIEFPKIIWILHWYWSTFMLSWVLKKGFGVSCQFSEVCRSWRVTQQTFNYPKPIIKTVEEGVEYTFILAVLVLLFLTLNITDTFFYCFLCWIWTGKNIHWVSLQKPRNLSWKERRTQEMRICFTFPEFLSFLNSTILPNSHYRPAKSQNWRFLAKNLKEPGDPVTNLEILASHFFDRDKFKEHLK